MTDELFFDTDCISAFLWINNTNILHELYGGRIVLPEPVYSELTHPSIPHIKQRTENIIKNNDAIVEEIAVDTKEYKLYKELIYPKKGIKAIGRGEASAIALAKTYDGVLASNNYKDISQYIEKFNIKHIDTGQILVEALNKKIITEDEGNIIWNKMLSKNRKLPASSFSEYLFKNNNKK